MALELCTGGKFQWYISENNRMMFEKLALVNETCSKCGLRLNVVAVGTLY